MGAMCSMAIDLGRVQRWFQLCWGGVGGVAGHNELERKMEGSADTRLLDCKKGRCSKESGSQSSPR